MGHDPRGRRHATPAWLDMTVPETMLERGRKLVVQMVETYQKAASPPSWKRSMPWTWQRKPACRWPQ